MTLSCLLNRQGKSPSCMASLLRDAETAAASLRPSATKKPPSSSSPPRSPRPPLPVNFFLLEKGWFVVEKACFLSEIIGFLKAGAWRTCSSSGSLWVWARPCRRRDWWRRYAAGGSAAKTMQTWVQQGIKKATEKRYLKSASLIIIDDCDEAVERYVFKLPGPKPWTASPYASSPLRPVPQVRPFLTQTISQKARQ